MLDLENALEYTEDPNTGQATVQAMQPINHEVTQDMTATTAIEHGDGSGFWQNFKDSVSYISKKYEQGKAPLYRGTIWNEALYGKMTTEEAQLKSSIYAATHPNQIDDVAFKDHPVRVMMGEAANIGPSMISGGIEGFGTGVVGAATLGGAALIAGAGIPGPEEIVTVPGAALVGFSSGTRLGVFRNAARVEGGNAYGDLINRGVDPKIAKAVSIPVGIANGLLEASFLGVFDSFGKKTLKELVSTEAGKKTIATLTKAYLKNVGFETGTEGLQQMNTLIATALSLAIDQNPNAAKLTKEEVLTSMTETLVKTSEGMAVLGAFGVAGNVMWDKVANIRGAERKAPVSQTNIEVGAGPEPFKTGGENNDQARTDSNGGQALAGGEDSTSEMGQGNQESKGSGAAQAQDQVVGSQEGVLAQSDNRSQAKGSSGSGSENGVGLNSTQAPEGSSPLQPGSASSLHQEALKYNTAEEFVAAQGDTLFHGTNSDFKEFKIMKTTNGREQGDGIYLAKTQEKARIYGNKVMETQVKLNNPVNISSEGSSEIVSLGGDKFNDIEFVKEKTFTDINDAKIFVEKIREANKLELFDKEGDKYIVTYRELGAEGANNERFYRGVRREYPSNFNERLKEGGFDGLVSDESVIVFDPKNIKTKQQLTDIWNEAHANKQRSAAMMEGQTTEKLTQMWNDENLTEAEKLAAMPEEKAARITKINSDIKALQAQLAETERTTAEREKVGKPVKANIDRSTTIFNQIDALQNERHDLQTNPEAVVGKKHGEVRADQIRSLITKNLKDRVAKLAEGVRAGKVIAQNQIKAIQNEVISAIQQSEISPQRKAQFMRTVKNIQTQQQFTKAAPVLDARLTALEEEFKIRALRGAVQQMLKASKPKKTSGVVKGMDAEAQKSLAQIKEYSELTTAQVEARLLAPETGDNVALLEMAGDIRSMGSEELQRLAVITQQIIADGRSKLLDRLAARQATREGVRAEAVVSMFGEGEPSQTVEAAAELEKGFKESFDGFIAQGARKFSVWDALMDALSSKDPKHALTKLFDMNKTLETWKANQNKQHEAAYAEVQKAGGFKDFKALYKYMNEGVVVEPLGPHTVQTMRPDGTLEVKTKPLRMSRNQAIYAWGKMQEPGMRENLQEVMGWTFREDVLPGEVSTQEALENFIGKQGQDIANAILDFYKVYGEETNPFYRDRYGIDMRTIQRYSPQTREGDLNETDILNPKSKAKRLFTPAPFFDRTSSKKKIVEQDAFTALTKHIVDIEHFKALSDKVDKLDAVFNDIGIRKAIENTYGRGLLTTIDTVRGNFAAGKTPALSEATASLEKMRINMVKARLAAKGTISAKQVVQTLGYMMHPDITATGWLKNFAYTLAHMPEAIEFITNTETFKNRGATMERDIKSAINSSQFQLVKGMNSINDAMVAYALFGDKVSVVLGGYAAYKTVLEKTGSKEKALEVFSKATNETQQSANLDQQTVFGSNTDFFGKLASTFMTGQNQVFNMVTRAAKDFYFNPSVGNAKQFAKALVVGHIIIPMLMQFMTNGFQWDTDDEIRSALLGSLNGVFFFADLTEALVASAYNFIHRKDKDYKKAQIFGAGNILTDAINNVTKSVAKLFKEDVSLLDVFRAVAAFVEPLTGMPLVTAGNMAVGVGNVAKGDYAPGIAELFGYSPYIVEGKGKKKTSQRQRAGY